MICTDLPATGMAHPLLALILFCVGACLIVGLLLRIGVRRRGTGAAIIAVLLLGLGAGTGVAPASVAVAASVACVSAPVAGGSLTIAQTSVMNDLGPGIPPVAITGTVTNNSSTDSTYITAIAVSIDSIAMAPGASGGSCDASDYVLLEPNMLVGETLEPGGSTAFGGASIGFSDKATNQDACQGAIVRLLYRTDG